MADERPGDNALQWHPGDMPYSPLYGDHYYSRADGRAECDHVFLTGNGLPGRWQNAGTFVIGELGFGTGLNILETWRVFEATRPLQAKLSLHSFEAHPLHSQDIKRALAVWPELDHLVDRFLPLWPERPETLRDITIALDAETELTVHVGDAATRIADLSEPVDAWFLDGFAPSRNPEMWRLDLLEAVARKSAAGATCATYSAAGLVRRNLIEAGFTIEKAKGFAGKREMLHGRLAG